MADPVGITGTAIGVISFGLQLYTGITQYLDAVKGRDEDLQRAKQYVNAFQASLKVLGDTILKVNDEQAAAKHVVQDCKISCEAELTALDALLNDLKGPQIPSDDPISKVKGSLQKWSYPFKQRNLSRLEERLESANSIIKLSLSALHLAMLNNQEKAILDLQNSVNIIQVTAGNISGATLQQSGALKLANDTLTQSHQEIKNISQRVSLAPFDPRIDEILSHLRNIPNAQHQSAQLVAYQQDLKTLCDAVRNLSPHVATQMADHGIPKANFKNVQSRGNQCCYCARRRGRIRKEVRWGMLFFETELEKTVYHTPECRFSKLVPPTQKKMNAIGISVPRITRILSHAVRFSMSLKTGAGGMSLAQNITWTATINEHSSPAFRIIGSLCALKRGPGQGLRAEHHYAVAESCIRRLELCYTNHLASPSDTNACGQSILDILAARLCQGRFDTKKIPVDDIAYIFRALATINVPVAHNPDTNLHFLSLVTESDWLFKIKDPVETISTLLPCCDDLTRHAYQGSPHTPSRNIEALKEFPQIAENFGLNPLSQAILTEEEETVRFLVKQYPSYMREVDYCGRSPVHIAIKSIYEYICDRETAEIALSNGFSREHAFIDVFRSIVESVIQGKCYGWPDLSYIDWIVDDGVEIASDVPLDLVPGVTPCTTWAHYLMASFGNGLRWNWAAYDILPPKVSKVAFSDAAYGESQCHCSLKGCTPLIGFLEGLGWRTWSFEGLQTLRDRLTKLSESLQALLPDIGGAYSWVYPAVLRYLTFSALGLRHTCYGLENMGSIPVWEADDIEEIHDEDSAFLQLLEDLVEEFEIRSGSISSSDMSSFLRDVWAPKIQGTLEESSRRELTEENLRHAEDCGVVWRDHQHEDSRMTLPYLPFDLEGWMKRLDDIAIDPQRPRSGAPEYLGIKGDTGF